MTATSYYMLNSYYRSKRILPIQGHKAELLIICVHSLWLED